MDTLLPIGTLLFVGAITPGPINFIIMSNAVCRGFTACLPLIFVIVSGTLIILAVVWSGSMLVLENLPWLQTAITVAGAGFLIWLGIRLMITNPGSDTKSGRESAQKLPASALAVFLFQFVNPKGWIVVATVVSAAKGADGMPLSFLALAILFAAIPFICMPVWASAGAAIAQWLRSPSHQIRLNRIMGFSLAVSAGYLLI